MYSFLRIIRCVCDDILIVTTSEAIFLFGFHVILILTPLFDWIRMDYVLNIDFVCSWLI